MPASSGKGRALTELAEIYGIETQDIYAIGDSPNDLSMFEVAGHRIAMENAIDELKEKAPSSQKAMTKMVWLTLLTSFFPANTHKEKTPEILESLSFYCTRMLPAYLSFQYVLVFILVMVTPFDNVT